MTGILRSIFLYLKKPKVCKVQREFQEKGGICWVFSPEDFDDFFAGIHVFLQEGKIWGFMQTPLDPIKVYRGDLKVG